MEDSGSWCFDYFRTGTKTSISRCEQMQMVPLSEELMSCCLMKFRGGGIRQWFFCWWVWMDKDFRRSFNIKTPTYTKTKSYKKGTNICTHVQTSDNRSEACSKVGRSGLFHLKNLDKTWNEWLGWENWGSDHNLVKTTGMNTLKEQ